MVGKRNCKSRYRKSTPDSPKAISPINRSGSRGFTPLIDDHVSANPATIRSQPPRSGSRNFEDDSQRSTRISHSPGLESTAFQTSSGSYGHEMSQRSRPVFTHCGGLGHVVDRCYKKHGFPPGYKSKGMFQPQRKSFSPTPISTNLVVNPDHSPILPTPV